ncbi:MAG: hypothetical protein HYW47_00270 [Deltaproteobacteria bacterium]|nr:hypothetical protein [Deltaproteobacteria bacterium]
MFQDYKPGDIIFSNMDCDEGNAIQTSTQSPYTHVGIAHFKDQKMFIIEAWGLVKLTSIEEWLQNCQKRIAVGRVLEKYNPIAHEASYRALGFLGRPYNHYYEETSEKLYCASLIYYAFRLANEDQDFFTLKPMNFKDAWEHWKKYFGNRHIPQGKPGINPGYIYNSPKIRIVYDYRHKI